MEKDFIDWHALKEWLHDHHNAPTFHEREIWWCHIGMNVGIEQDGKDKPFHRPVLVLRKFNKRLFWGVPLTSKLKEFPFYFPIHFQARHENEVHERQAILSQLRAYDSKRLTRFMARIGKEQFGEILAAVQEILKKPQ